MVAVQKAPCQFSVASPSPVLASDELAQEITKAVAWLARRPGLREVWLFGSAARGEVLDWRSDLDFAVKGLAEADWGQAWAGLDETVRLPVDLVRMETANPALREAVTREGHLLYEA